MFGSWSHLASWKVLGSGAGWGEGEGEGLLGRTGARSRWGEEKRRRRVGGFEQKKKKRLGIRIPRFQLDCGVPYGVLLLLRSTEYGALRLKKSRSCPVTETWAHGSSMTTCCIKYHPQSNNNAEYPLYFSLVVTCTHIHTVYVQASYTGPRPYAQQNTPGFPDNSLRADVS